MRWQQLEEKDDDNNNNEAQRDILNRSTSNILVNYVVHVL